MTPEIRSDPTPLWRQWVARAGTLLAIASALAVLWPIWKYGSRIGQTIHGGTLAGAVVAGAVAYGLLAALLAVAWWWLAGIYGARPPLPAGVSVWARTQIAKYLPGNVFHYVGRQVMGRQIGLTHPALVASGFLEFVSVLTAAVIIQLVGVAVTRTTVPSVVSLPLLGALVALGLLAWPAIDWLLRRVPALASYMRELPSLSLTRAVRLMGPALLLHVAFLLGTGLILFTLLRAGWPDAAARWQDVIWLYALAWAAGTLTPGAPGGVGVREAVLTLLLAGAVGQANAAALSLALRVVTLVGDALTAGWGWVIPLRRRITE